MLSAPLGLSVSERFALANIIALADKNNPSKSIYIRKANLADRMGTSEPSLRRHLAALQKQGYIARDQFISRAAGAQVGTITLTEMAIGLFFDEAPSPAAQQQTPPAREVLPCSVSSDASEVIPKQCLHSKQRTQDSLDAAKKEAERKLKPELHWLLPYIDVYGIFELMPIARKAGTTLQHVADIVRNGLISARSGYAYLKAVLAQDCDWSYYTRREEKQQKQEAVKADQEAVVQRRKGASVALQGKPLLDSKTGRYLVPMGSSALVYLTLEDLRLNRPSGALPFNDQLLLCIESGRINIACI